MISRFFFDLQGLIPCDSAGAQKPDLAVGISHGSHLSIRDTFKSMFSRNGVIEKGPGVQFPSTSGNLFPFFVRYVASSGRTPL